MTQDMWLSGFSVVRMTVASSTPEAYVFGYLEDVAPDGTAILVAQGRLLASQRKEGPAPYDTLGLPWHTGLRADAQPMVPGRAVEMAFDLSPTSRIIATGHRLRLSFTGADQRQRNLPDLKTDPAPVLDITTGGRAASSLELTLLPVDRLPKKDPAA